MTDIDWEIRPYEESNAGEVRALLEAAFETTAEAELAEALRKDGDAEIELIADADGEAVGYIILSRMSSPERALGLGPIAAAEHARKIGVGSSLIESSLALATANDWHLVFLLGDPQYYERFGFSVEAADRFTSPYAGSFFQVAILDEDEAARTGEAVYAAAFERFE